MAPGVPHFQCWKARYSKGANKLSKDNRYNVIDQLSNANYQVTNPTRLCLPADKHNGSPAGPFSAWCNLVVSLSSCGGFWDDFY